MIQDLIFILVTLFMIITVVFITKYRRLLVLAQSEYIKSKTIVSEIVLVFKKRLDIQENLVKQLTHQTDTINFSMVKVANNFKIIEEKVKDLFIKVESNHTNQEYISNIDIIKEEIKTISENQLKLKGHLIEIEKRIENINGEKKGIIIEDEKRTFSKLTETEQIILQLLTNEGAKSAPEVEKKIVKTREHTARLMKKLWQEGYIERDTHRIPYIYRITDNLRKIETDINST